MLCTLVYFCCPETQGKSLEEIDLVFVSQSLKDNSAAAQTLYRRGEDVEGGSGDGSFTKRDRSSEEGSLAKDAEVGELEIHEKGNEL